MLTPEQLPTLKAAILADSILLDAWNAGSPNKIVGAFNVVEPAYYVWKELVYSDEVLKNGMDWTQVDNLSVGKARIWDWLTKDGTFNPSKQNVRDGIIECWKGTSAMLAVQASVFTHCKRNATRGEKLFSTGTGSLAVPARLVFSGNITDGDVEAAMR